jgi:NAD+ diphosphatase
MPEMRFCPASTKPLGRREESGLPRLACPDATCGYVFYDNPTPVVAALLEHEGAVVLVRNKGWPDEWFGLVSGFLERGEAPEAGVLREVREETGLEGELAGLIGAYAFPEMNQVIIAYHVRGRGEVALGAEIAAARRVTPEKLRPWPFGTGPAVRDWLARRQAT